jgi:hypothetical protein
MTSGYRLAPALGARLLGSVLLALAVLVFVVTLVAATMQWPPVVLLVTLGAGLLAVTGVVVGAYVASNRLEVVSLDARGYRVRFVRGAGVRSATWDEVANAVTGEVSGVDCVVLRLKDGRTTSIPVSAVAADRDEFVADLREHLRRGEGLRPL